MDHELALCTVRDILDLHVITEYNPTRVTYEIEISWRIIAGSDFVSLPLDRRYIVETYPSGPSNCTVTEPEYSVSGGAEYVTRGMVPYDMGVLYETLNRFFQFNVSIKKNGEL